MLRKRSGLLGVAKKLKIIIGVVIAALMINLGSFLMPEKSVGAMGLENVVAVENEGETNGAENTEGEGDENEGEEEEKATSDQPASCSERSGVLGWLICGFADFVSGATDSLFGVISGFLRVEPLNTTDEPPIHMVWEYIRNISNSLFIIAILIVVISQITGAGISNYGVKKILPKLVMVAILVNLSFVVCQIAVDLSNILGGSLVGLFDTVKELVRDKGITGVDNIGLNEILGWITGGTAIGVVGIAAAGGFKAAFFLLLPVLFSALIAVVAAVLTLAVRQALIILLVIISPLAIASNLLPNTEKFFKWWRDLLLKMLLMFPLFALLFGASNLAGWVVLASADSILKILLGYAIQIVPLVFTPFLIKFSGNLLGGINNGIRKAMNGAEKGVRGFGERKAGLARAKYLAGRGIAPTRKLAQKWNYGETRDKKLTDKLEAGTKDKLDAKYAREELGHKMERPRREDYKTTEKYRRALERYKKDGERARKARQFKENNPGRNAAGALQYGEEQKRLNEAAQGSVGRYITNQAKSAGTNINRAELDSAAMKMREEASKKKLEAYLDTERAKLGGKLGAAKIDLEGATLDAKRAADQLSAKIKTEMGRRGTGLYEKNIKAEEAAGYLKVAETEVKTSVDKVRATSGTRLADLNVKLETAMADAQEAESLAKKLLEDEASRTEKFGENGEVEHIVSELGRARMRAATAKEGAEAATLTAANLHGKMKKYYENIGATQSDGRSVLENVGSAATRVQIQEMANLAQMADDYEFDKRLAAEEAKVNTRASIADFNKQINDAHLQHANHPTTANIVYDRIVRAGIADDNGVISIIGAAAAAIDADDRRILEDEKIAMGKATQGNEQALIKEFEVGLAEKNAFRYRAAVSNLAKSGAYGIGLLEKSMTKLFENEGGAYDEILNDPTVMGILANHIANSGDAGGDTRKKAGMLWYWAKHHAGKNLDGQYLNGYYEDDTKDPEFGNLRSYAYSADEPLMQKHAKQLVKQILTKPGDLISEGAGTIKQLFRAGAIDERKAQLELEIAGANPALIADLDDDKLLYLGVASGKIFTEGIDYIRDPSTGKLRFSDEAAAVEKVDKYMRKFRKGGDSEDGE